MALDLSEMLSICDERVGVRGHVCAEEARSISDGIRHGGNESRVRSTQRLANAASWRRKVLNSHSNLSLRRNPDNVAAVSILLSILFTKILMFDTWFGYVLQYNYCTETSQYFLARDNYILCNM